MKKWIAYILVVCMVICFMDCGNETGGSDSARGETISSDADTGSDDVSGNGRSEESRIGYDGNIFSESEGSNADNSSTPEMPDAYPTAAL